MVPRRRCALIAVALTAADREQVTRYVYSRPEEFGVRLMPLPAELQSAEVRRQLDCSENWELAQRFTSRWCADEWDRCRLAGFVTRQCARPQTKTRVQPAADSGMNGIAGPNFKKGQAQMRIFNEKGVRRQ